MENQNVNQENVNQNADNASETKENIFKRLWKSPKTKKVIRWIGNAAGGFGLFVVGALLGKNYEERHPEEHEKLTDGTIETESSVE